MTRIVTTLLFLTSHMLAYGQELQHGLIMPEKIETEGICCIFTPPEGFTVYERPGGEKTGTLTRNISEREGFESFFEIYFVDVNTQKATEITVDHFREVGYRKWALTYFERRNGFVRIIDRQYNYWLSEREIANKGFQLMEWQDFVAENPTFLQGFFAISPGLNLRESPTTESEIIEVLKGVRNRIDPTDEHSGLWTKVEVTIFKEDPCNTHLSKEKNIEQELEGWIKIVDDSGKPNVSFRPRGC